MTPAAGVMLVMLACDSARARLDAGATDAGLLQPDADVSACQSARVDTAPMGWQVDKSFIVARDVHPSVASVRDIVPESADVSLLKISAVERIPVDGSPPSRWDLPAGSTTVALTPTLVAAYLAAGNVGYCIRDTVPPECLVVGATSGNFWADPDSTGGLRLFWSEGNTFTEVSVSPAGVANTPLALETPSQPFSFCVAARGANRVMGNKPTGACESFYVSQWVDNQPLGEATRVLDGSHAGDYFCDARANETGYVTSTAWRCRIDHSQCTTTIDLHGGVIITGRWGEPQRRIMLDEPGLRTNLSEDGTIWIYATGSEDGRWHIQQTSLNEPIIHSGYIDVSALGEGLPGGIMQALQPDGSGGAWASFVLFGDTSTTQVLAHIIPIVSTK